jgi:hypothetical protein
MALVRRWLVAVLWWGWLCTGTAWAQSAYGPGGLFLVPSAYASDAGAVELGMMGAQRGMWAPGHPHDHSLVLSTAVGYGVSDRAQVGFTNIVMRDITHRPTWGAFGKYVLAAERGDAPAVAVSAVWLPVWHWRTETVALSASKTLRLSNDVVAHVHAGALHARWLNGVKTDRHPYAPRSTPDGYPAPADPLYDAARPVTRQAPFAAVDIALTRHVRLTAEGRTRTIADDSDAIPGMVGVVFVLPKAGRIGFAWGTDGLDDKNTLTIGVGYNISTVE